MPITFKQLQQHAHAVEAASTAAQYSEDESAASAIAYDDQMRASAMRAELASATSLQMARDLVVPVTVAEAARVASTWSSQVGFLSGVVADFPGLSVHEALNQSIVPAVQALCSPRLLAGAADQYSVESAFYSIAANWSA